MDLFKYFSPETTILTPNRRLSADLLKKYSQWQSEQGLTCWHSISVLPLYPSWLETLWKQYSARTLSQNDILLTTHQEQIIWEKILRDDPKNESLLQLTDTAKLAKSAWEILKRWQVHLNHPALTLTDDSRAFLTWASQFQKICKKNAWMDHSSLADRIAEKIATRDIVPPKKIILNGFNDIPPQYQYLFNICESVGSEVIYVETPSRNEHTHRIALTDTDTEIRTMARWAKSLLNQSSSIACIIPHLEDLRENILREFSDVLQPEQFNISAGKTLISYPIIYDAIKLLNLNTDAIPLQAFSHVLRSPFIGEAERERYKRASYDNRLKNSNINTISLSQIINPEIKSNLTTHCPALSNRLKHFVTRLEATPKTLKISEWVNVFNDLLSQIGWPGERSINSHEYQVIQNSWLPLLHEYATFDDALGPQSYQTALHYLTSLASHTVFQPESPTAPVQILGLLEAAMIPFEHSWIMGLDDTSWPARPKPNPFIPLRLQKELKMPSSSAERELIYCQQLTTQLQQSTSHVIFSYPLQREDTELRPSSLLKNFNPLEIEHLNLSSHSSSTEEVYQHRQIEIFQDDQAPALTENCEIKGGVSIFKTQAECPFKAFAEIRLHAKKIEETTLGLRKIDRGNIIHKALELIWRELQDHNTLLMISDHELRDLIHKHAEQALNELIEFNQNNSRYLALELIRLEKLLWDWLEKEKARTPFKVIATEQEITAKIGHITAHFRVDRIDELLQEAAQGSQLIIDYKTSKNLNKNDWFGERLSQPQLPIYCLANPTATIGIAFANIHPQEMKLMGASKTPLKLPAIELLADIDKADASLWDEQIRIWQHHLHQLSQDFFEGKANVDPKDPNQTCRLCHLQPLCRIHELKHLDKDDDNYDDHS